MAGFALLMTLALIIAAPTVVRVLFGREFGPTAELLRILSFTLPLGMSAMTLAVMWLVPRQQDRAITRLVLVAGPLNIVLLLSLVPPLGIVAAAWTLVAIEGLTLLGYGYLIRAAGIRTGMGRPRAARAG